jgi:hypothetical protein
MREILGRALCVLLLMAHARALIAAWQYGLAGGFTAELAGVVLLLSAATVVFALKVVGVRWVRLPRDRRAFVATCLILAIIHLGCLDPEMPSAFVSKWVVVLATAPLVVAAIRIARVAGTTHQAATSSRKTHLPNARSHEEAWLDWFHPHCLLLSARLFRLRAPPA